MKRCKWCNENNERYVKYHDEEWGKLNLSEPYLFEMLLLESFQAGLSWECVLNKREHFRQAYDNFDIEKICRYDEQKINTLLNNPGIIRNRNKIFSVRKNALAVRQIQTEFGSFDAYLWNFTGGRQIDGCWKTPQEVPTESEVSRKMSRDMKKRGIAYVGPVITYSFLQAIGIVNDHLADCEYRNERR